MTDETYQAILNKFDKIHEKYVRSLKTDDPHVLLAGMEKCLGEWLNVFELYGLTEDEWDNEYDRREND